MSGSTVAGVQRRRWWVAAVVLLAVVVTVVIVRRWSSAAGQADVAALEQAAARVPTAPGWQPGPTLVRTDGQLCVDAACPSVSRRWTSAAPPNPRQLRALLGQAGFPAAHVEGDCQPVPKRSGAIPLCHARAQTSGQQIELTVTGPMEPQTYAIALVVTPT